MSGARAYASWVLDHRAGVAPLLFLSTVVAAAGIYDPIAGKPRIRIDPSLNEMLPESDPARLFYEDLLERFGSDEVVVVAFLSDTLFSVDGLATLKSATAELARAEGVHRVEGLATAVRLRPTARSGRRPLVSRRGHGVDRG